MNIQYMLSRAAECDANAAAFRKHEAEAIARGDNTAAGWAGPKAAQLEKQAAKWRSDAAAMEARERGTKP